jgi:hypothetical protein
MPTAAALTELMTAKGHEQVVFVADAPSGLRAVIARALDALAVLGGIGSALPSERTRRRPLRLSEAMSPAARRAGPRRRKGRRALGRSRRAARR